MNPLRLTLRQLQIFVAVAHGGSTTAAADAIALSQSATSAAINELERLLSLRLFDRSGKRILLNDNGRALLPRAVALLDGAAAIERMARDGREQAQTLRIGASTTIGSYVLPALLARYLGGRHRDAATDWRSKVTIANTAAVCRAVAKFDLDIGLIEGPCHEAALAVTPWLRDELIVVAAPGSALARPRAPRPALRDLRDQVWLLREPGSGTREATDQALLPHLHAFRRSIELASSEAIKHAAAENVGIACLSRWVVRDLIEAGTLREVTTTLPRLFRQCFWVVHRDKQPTAAVQEFLRNVAEARSAAKRPGAPSAG